jgi:hypothetical protein
VRLGPTNRPAHADKHAPNTDPCRRTATNPHLSLTTSPCGRDVFGAVCEPSPRRRAPDDFRSEPHAPFAWRRASDVRRVQLATKPSDVCRTRTADKPPDGRHCRTARASASVRVIARCLVGHGTDICPSARFGRHTAAGFAASCPRRKGASAARCSRAEQRCRSQA